MLKFRTRLSLVLVVIGLAAAGSASPVDVERMRADTERLTAGAHRLSGTPEMRAAVDFVFSELQAAGGDDAFLQFFNNTQTDILRCEAEVIDAEGNVVRTLPLVPARPNMTMAPVSPVSGIEGRVIPAGNGELDSFTEVPRDAIVAMDWNSGKGWLRAFRMGANAVIFLRNEVHEGWHSHHSPTPANLPRYYYDGDPQDILGAERLRIHSEIVWPFREGINVIGFLKGTAPEYFLEAPETIVLAAPLDSFGDVPRRSPGARKAANAAGLLELYRHFAKPENRPTRNLLFVFFDNEARSHAGAFAFYRALADMKERNSDAALDKRLAVLTAERALRRESLEALDNQAPAEWNLNMRRELETRMRKVANTRTTDLRMEIGEINLRMEEMRANIRADLIEATGEAPEADIQRRLERHPDYDDLVVKREVLDDLDQKWNDFKRAQKKAVFPPEIAGQLEDATTAVRSFLHARLDEIAYEEQALAADTRLFELIGSTRVVMHLSLMFGDGSSHWGIAAGGSARHARFEEDKMGLYGSHFNAWGESLKALRAAGGNAPGFLEETTNASINPPSLIVAGRGFTHSGAAAGWLAVMNMVAVTAQDPFPREGTPDDTLDNLDFEALARQVSEVGMLLSAAADSEFFSLQSKIQLRVGYAIAEFRDGRIYGPQMLARLRGSSLPDTPVAGGLAVIYKKMPTSRDNSRYTFEFDPVPAFDDFFLNRTNALGSFHYGPFIKKTNLETGRGFAFDERGVLALASTKDRDNRVRERITMFEAFHGALVLPLQYRPDVPELLDGLSNAKVNAKESNFGLRDGIFWWVTETTVERVKVFHDSAVTALKIPDLAVAQEIRDPNNLPVFVDRSLAAAEQPRDYSERMIYGLGIENRQVPDPIASSFISAEDTIKMDRYRLSILRGRGINNASIDEIHGAAQDRYAEALASTSVAAAESGSAAAYLKERTVYEDTTNSMKDLVTAVLVLLLLTIPFAYALERLIFGFTNIYKQVGGFAGFFVATFMALYFTHPAFAISATPLVIFLGFSIILLSSLVIIIILQKFEVELKAIQGMASTVHAADVSRLGTVMAAMNMGISSMRRRPLRTVLTGVTIILLTFTILTFASFGRQAGIVSVYEGLTPSYSGATAHRINWREINPEVLDLVKGQYGREHTVAPRYWYSPIVPDPKKPIVNNPGVFASSADFSKHIPVRGLIGFTEAEIAERADLRELFKEGRASFGSTVWMTETLANRLGAAPGDEVLIAGQRLTLAPFVDAPAFLTATDMNGSNVLPVDLSQVDPSEQAASNEDEDVEAASSQSWTYLPVDSVAVVSADVARLAGGDLRVISVYTDDATSAVRVAEDFAKMVTMPVSATRSNGVYKHVFGNILSASGVKDLFFPILLGGLVIFGTMLGSVADREKEIYTFSALGLAPPHVASLFFAEALVFSIVGGMGGYLFAQVVMKILGFFAEFGLLTMPEMNYSSINAVVTIILVMCTVMVSAIYPAMKASRSANPGVMRGWKLPEPTGDELSLVFPFTVSEYDITGVVSFLKEHFENFSDTSVGVFMARETEFLEMEEGSVGLKAHLALAPFDLGVTQDFELYSQPSEIPGIDEVKIHITRRSGQPKDWARLNKVLMDDLRKQFLIWRSLPKATMEEYRMNTLVELGREEEAAKSA